MALTVVEYTIKAVDGGNEVLAPGDFTLRASNDGFLTWDVLDTQVGQVFIANEVKTYNFANLLAYRGHRVHVTATFAGVTSVFVREIELREAIAGPDATPAMTNFAVPIPWVVTEDGHWMAWAGWKALDDLVAPGTDGWGVGGACPHWLAIDDGVDPPAPPPGPDPWEVADRNLGALAGIPPRSGRMVREDGAVVNIADTLDSGLQVVSGLQVPPGTPRSGRYIAEDGSVVNIADSIDREV